MMVVGWVAGYIRPVNKFPFANPQKFAFGIGEVEVLKQKLAGSVLSGKTTINLK